VDIPFVL